MEEIILQSHGRPRSSGSESCGSTNDRTVKEQVERPVSGLAEPQVNGGKQNSCPTMTSTPGEKKKFHFRPLVGFTYIIC